MEDGSLGVCSKKGERNRLWYFGRGIAAANKSPALRLVKQILTHNSRWQEDRKLPSSNKPFKLLGGRQFLFSYGKGFFDNLNNRRPICRAFEVLSENARRALDEAAKLELVHHRDRSFHRFGAQHVRLEGKLKRDIANDGGEPLALPHLFLIAVHLLPKLLGKLGPLLEHVFNRAEGVDELGGTFVSDPGDARNVVAGVPLDRLKVRYEFGTEAIPFDYRSGIVSDRIRNAGL